MCSPTITAADARAWRDAIGGRPLLLWDNYPVNDAVMERELHLGPYRGRDPDLSDVVDGVLCNPMLQPRASLVALATAAEYLGDPGAYRRVRGMGARHRGHRRDPGSVAARARPRVLRRPPRGARAPPGRAAGRRASTPPSTAPTGPRPSPRSETSSSRCVTPHGHGTPRSIRSPRRSRRGSIRLAARPTRGSPRFACSSRPTQWARSTRPIDRTATNPIPSQP